jgi:hypothetical protein
MSTNYFQISNFKFPFYRYSVPALVGTLLFFSACKSKKSIVTNPRPVKLKEQAFETLYAQMDSGAFAFDWMTAKADAEATSNGQTNSFEINLRIRNDSAIWLSLTATALNIEGIRVLITQDSIKMLDRINKKYIISNFAEMSDLLHAEVNFDMLQNVVSGNFFQYKEEEKLRSVYLDSTDYILSNLRKRKLKRELEDKDINIKLIHDIWLDPFTYRIQRTKWDDNKNNKEVNIYYSDFRDVGGKQFPFAAEFDVKAAKPVNIKINYDKVTVNEPQTMPFSIPDKYEQIIEGKEKKKK